jgi:hypothetical protein
MFHGVQRDHVRPARRADAPALAGVMPSDAR